MMHAPTASCPQKCKFRLEESIGRNEAQGERAARPKVGCSKPQSLFLTVGTDVFLSLCLFAKGAKSEMEPSQQEGRDQSLSFPFRGKEREGNQKAFPLSHNLPQVIKERELRELSSFPLNSAM